MTFCVELHLNYNGGCNSVAECLLPKQDVEGSNPFTRSIKLGDDLPRLDKQRQVKSKRDRWWVSGQPSYNCHLLKEFGKRGKG